MALQKIYIEVVVLKRENAVELTKAEMLAIPCHEIMAMEAETRMLVIEYRPGSHLATKERIVEVHLQAYSRKFEIVSWTVFDGFLTAERNHTRIQ